MKKRVLICGGVRTPIGHLGKTLAAVQPEDLLTHAIKGLLAQYSLDPAAIDGLIMGWVGQGSHAPNIARIAGLLSGIPETATAYTVQSNCVSGMESIASAVRAIQLDEGEVFIAGGTESMSSFPYAIRGARSQKPLRNMNALKANWQTLWDDKEVAIIDCIEEGLTDQVKHINMAETAEVCAQRYGITRTMQDDYAAETFRRCFAAEENGFYGSHVIPFSANGVSLERDEYVYARKALVEDASMFTKAPVLFQTTDHPFSKFYDDFGAFIPERKYHAGETEPTVTLFNSCARSDAAAAVIVASESAAVRLGLPVLAEVLSYATAGVNPAYMGIAPAHAAPIALKRAGVSFDAVTNIELHEAFAATVLSAFAESKKEFGCDWEALWRDGRLNPHGGSIPLGHPLAATGTRLVLSLIYAMMENKDSKFGLAAACASGGIGGAMVIARP
ncbi:MAG: thiolase family protein [Spirochaetota bacterium]